MSSRRRIFVGIAIPLFSLAVVTLSALQAQSVTDAAGSTPAALEANLPPAGAPPKAAVAYKIGVDDILTISVWHEPDLSHEVPVRPDGKISLPLVGEIQAAGCTAPELEASLKAALATYVKDPVVTVIVAQIRSLRVNVIGQVMHPGTFPLTQSTGVLDALAWAGGLRDFAKKGGIYVLRSSENGRRVRMNYDYKAVLKGKSGAQDILLQPNDTVVVP